MKYREHMRQAERDYLAALMVSVGGNITRASAIAGTNRTYFYHLLDRSSVRPKSAAARKAPVVAELSADPHRAVAAP